MGKLRRHIRGLATLAVCAGALAMSIVGMAGASPLNNGPSVQDKPNTIQGRSHVLTQPLRIGHVVASDRVNFDIAAVALHPGRSAEVAGGANADFRVRGLSGRGLLG